MSGQPAGPIILQPFGVDADPADIQFPIPQTPAGVGRANYEEGFPPITMQPVIAGGKPPYGQDVNGILYTVTAALAALQAGQLTPYNAGLATAMGGYKLGSVLAMTDGTGIWFSTADGNSTNPDTGGANWTALYRYGYATIAGLTGGVVVASVLDARSPVLILSGALVANLQLVLPNYLQEWLIVNNTSGGFTVTVKTAAGGGVDVPSGGFSSPVRVYGDGTNLYPGAGTLTTPGSVAPTANTLALRDNLGQVYATRLYQTSALENPTVGAVFVQDNTADGALRKISLTNFEAQLLLQNIGGQLVNAQVPYGVVAQHAAALFANAALTGVPTAPTAAPGTNDTQIATTAFVNPGQSLGATGYQRLPSGLLIQWGTFNAAANDYTSLGFPVAHTVFSVCVTSGAYPNPNAQDNVPGTTASGLTTFTVYNANDNVIPTFWISVGF